MDPEPGNVGEGRSSALDSTAQAGPVLEPGHDHPAASAECSPTAAAARICWWETSWFSEWERAARPAR